MNLLTGTLPSELGRLTLLELLELDGGFTTFQRVRSVAGANYYGAPNTQYGASCARGTSMTRAPPCARLFRHHSEHGT